MPGYNQMQGTWAPPAPMGYPRQQQMPGYNPMPGGWVPNPIPQAQMEYPQQQQTVPVQQQQQHRPSVNNLIRVTGPESAFAYAKNLTPKSDVVVFDANEATFYWLSTDDSGYPTIQAFDFFRKQLPQQDAPIEVKGTSDIPASFATKDDVNNLSAKVDSFASDISEVKSMLKGLVS